MNQTHFDPSSWIVETSAQTFSEDVVERSRQVPVVVDFWAPWCHPCRLLGPELEKLANEYGGKFVLVKANSDQMPEVAAQFGVQAIPAVFGLRDGQIVDGFAGVLPEDQIRAFLEGLFPSEAEVLAAQGRELEAADAAAAEAKYREALARDSGQPVAKVGLARVLLAQGRFEESKQIVDELAGAGMHDAEVEALEAELTVRRHGKEAPSVADCRAAAEAAPDDLRLQQKLADALAAQQQYEDALAIYLKLIQADKAQFGESAKEAMVNIFHLLPADSDLVGTYRRKLAAALY
jgi:putative thioredoxin